MKLIETIAGCCPVGREAPLTVAEAEQVAAAFKVLGDPARLRLLGFIAAAGEACVCELTGPVDLSQPTVSHHLKSLHDAGFLRREKRGTWVYYRVVPDALRVLRDALDPSTATTDRYALKGE